MSNHLRHDKTCENCGYAVDVAYCSNCGQKNIETRQSFHHLAGHVVEDITHYDSGFWRTIKFLLLKPARLTQQYLLGKRQSFVPPVKLYIFISFITFFLLSIIPDTEGQKALSGKHRAETNTIKVNDTLRYEKKPLNVGNGKKVYSLAELEALRNGPETERPGFATYYLLKTVLIVREKEMNEKDLIDGLIHTLPKVLFIYMPIFAFWLWLLHGKKRWYFFDHSIFTLHYFSFLLILVIITRLLDFVFEFSLPGSVYDILSSIIGIFVLGYSFFYFFRAHSRMYGERKLISRLKSILLFVVNMICITILGVSMLAYIIIHSQHH